MASTRPDMRPYFRAQIDNETHGMMAGTRWGRTERPAGVARIDGRVTDRTIVVTMNDGTEWRWEGARYAARKRNGCYAPLMPKQVPKIVSV